MREHLKLQIISDMSNLGESLKMESNRFTIRYKKNITKDIDSAVRAIGREDKYIRSNRAAYEVGEMWLNNQGVML